MADERQKLSQDWALQRTAAKQRRQGTAVLNSSASTIRQRCRKPPNGRFLAALSGACAALLHLAGLPAAFFLGPMAAGVIMGVNGASIRVPRAPYIGAQAIMGAFIASAITPSILHSFFQDWPIILGVVFAIIAASSFLGWVMSRWRVMPGTTGVWGSSPGAAAAMVIMAAEFGADARLVAFGGSVDVEGGAEVDDLQHVQPQIAEIVVHRARQVAGRESWVPRSVRAAPGADLGYDHQNLWGRGKALRG